MKKFILVTGSLGLLVFIGASVWTLMGGKLPLLSYTEEAKVIVRDAMELSGANAAGGVQQGILKEKASKVRGQFNRINSRCTSGDRKRPSFAKLGVIVDQVEAAAEKPGSKVIVDARMAKVEELAKELTAILGTDQDKAGTE